MLPDPAPTDIPAVIREILGAGKTTYYIAKLMRRQVVQVQRMERTGRCQPHERDMLVMIRDDCLRNVSSAQPKEIENRV